MQVLMADSADFGAALDEVERQLRAARRGIELTRRWFPLTLDDADLKRAEVILVAKGATIDRSVLVAASSLRAVVALGIGTEFIDEASASERGVLVVYGASDENVESVAEATILLMLSLLYDLRAAEAVCRDGAPRSARRVPTMLRGLTVGLVGFGPIARAVARRLAGFGVTLLVHARRVEPGAHINPVPLDELLRRSDVVSIHVALAPSTTKLIGRDQIGQMKRTAVLINTARGAIVDEAALIEALAEGRIAGAGVDVFEVEPPLPDNPLLRSAATVVTPHILSQTTQAIQAAPRVAVANLGLIADGLAPSFIRNAQIVPAWMDRFGPART